MSEDFKNQHIVPVSYLNHFGTKQKSGKYLIEARTVKDNKLSKPFRQSTENVGYICNYYDVPERDDPKHWEHFFDENFDRLCGRKLGCIIAETTLFRDKAIVLNDEKIDMLSRIIVSQVFRVPEFFDYGYKKAEEIMERNKAGLIEKLEVVAPEKIPLVESIFFTDTQQKDIMLSGVFDKIRFNRCCDILKQKTWILVYNSDYKRKPFITCDNPVLVTKIDGSKTGALNVGIIHDDTAIFFPISPAVMIAIYSPSMLLGGIATLDKKKVIIKNEGKFISLINDKLSNQAFRYVFQKPYVT